MTTDERLIYKRMIQELQTANSYASGEVESIPPAVAPKVDVNSTPLGTDAWGRNKVIVDRSLVHSMFTYSVPANIWKEEFKGVEIPITEARSKNGMLELTAGATLGDSTRLSTFRSPRYQPNRGQIYSSSIICPNPDSNSSRRWGYFNEQSGAFFLLQTGKLKVVVRSTYDSVTTDQAINLNITNLGIDLAKGNTYDIQMQWRGVGNYMFYINNVLVHEFQFLGQLDRLTSILPAVPIAFECINEGANAQLLSGCADISTEGGSDNGLTYGSISIDNLEGQIAISGTSQWNVPILVVRSKKTVNTFINTRDTLLTGLTAYADQRAFVRVWVTRDDSAISLKDSVYRDYGDGHLEFIQYDNPDVTNPMTFDTGKAQLTFGTRIDIDSSFFTSALYEGKTNIYLTPGDIVIFTLHRETGSAFNGGVTLEFAEAI